MKSWPSTSVPHGLHDLPNTALSTIQITTIGRAGSPVIVAGSADSIARFNDWRSVLTSGGNIAPAAYWNRAKRALVPIVDEVPWLTIIVVLAVFSEDA